MSLNALKFFILSVCTAVTAIARAESEILIFADPTKKVFSLDEKTLDLLADILHKSRPATHLHCEVKARVISEDKKFTTGFERVHMLEVVFISRFVTAHEEKTYFPIGSKMSRRIVNSKWAGTVEEIELMADDRTNSRFIFHHDGQNELIWMSYEDDLRTTPCRLKN